MQGLSVLHDDDVLYKFGPQGRGHNEWESNYSAVYKKIPTPSTLPRKHPNHYLHLKPMLNEMYKKRAINQHSTRTLCDHQLISCTTSNQ